MGLVVVVDLGLWVWWLWVEERKKKKKIERQGRREVMGLWVGERENNK